LKAIIEAKNSETQSQETIRDDLEKKEQLQKEIDELNNLADSDKQK